MSDCTPETCQIPDDSIPAVGEPITEQPATPPTLADTGGIDTQGLLGALLLVVVGITVVLGNRRRR